MTGGSTARLTYCLCGLSYMCGGSSWFSALPFLVSAIASGNHTSGSRGNNDTWSSSNHTAGGTHTIVTSIVAGAFYVGMALGAGVCAWAGDRLGRRPSLIAAHFTSSVGAFACVVCPSSGEAWGLLVGAIVVQGAGVGGALPISSMLAVESMPTKHRGAIMGTLGIMFTGAGVIVAGLAWGIVPYGNARVHALGYDDWGWRLLFGLLGVCDVIAAIVLCLFLPESPRMIGGVGNTGGGVGEGGKKGGGALLDDGGSGGRGGGMTDVLLFNESSQTFNAGLHTGASPDERARRLLTDTDIDTTDHTDSDKTDPQRARSMVGHLTVRSMERPDGALHASDSSYGHTAALSGLLNSSVRSTCGDPNASLTTMNLSDIAGDELGTLLDPGDDLGGDLTLTPTIPPTEEGDAFHSAETINLDDASYHSSPAATNTSAPRQRQEGRGGAGGGGTKTPTPGRTCCEALAQLFERGAWRLTLPLWVLWASLSFAGNGYNAFVPAFLKELGVAPTEVYLDLVLSSASAMAGVGVTIFCVETRLGRKWTLAIFLVCMAAAMASYLALAPPSSSSSSSSSSSFSSTKAKENPQSQPSSSARSVETTITACVVNAMANGSWMTLYTLTSEVFPDSSRAAGVCAAHVIHNIAGVAGPFFGGFFVNGESFKPTVIFVFAALVGVAALAAACIPFDMRGRSLKEY